MIRPRRCPTVPPAPPPPPNSTPHAPQISAGPPGTGPTDARLAIRRRIVGDFVRRRYGLMGTLRLHRLAFGADLIRAPLNVTLAPLFLVIRLIAMMLGAAGLRRAAGWLSARQIFLTSDVARRIEADLDALITELDRHGAGPRARDPAVQQAVADYAETRNAVAEITTSLIVLAAGLMLFHQATPGVISLAGPVAEMRAQGAAIRDFALGPRLGGLWYGAFPTQIGPGRVIATGIVLAVAASVVTTFAGLIADPVQRITGLHRRRLMRMLARLDAEDAPARPAFAGEHLLARLGDLSDLALNLWRGLR